jgi:mannose-6-phosphate isomerase-like protein (cupin superfamily)
MTIDIEEAHIYGPGLPDIKNCDKREKVWGWEFILPTGEDYTTKYMVVKPGGEVSVHFHRDKGETFVLVQGILDVVYFTQYGDRVTERLERPLDALVLPRCTPHTFSVPVGAEGHTVFIESSTKDRPSDSYRLSRSKMNA